MTDYLSEGLSAATKAVDFDKNNNVDEAISHYRNALEFLEKAAVEQKDSQRRSLISKKMSEYKTRVKQLEQQQQRRDLIERTAKLGIGTLPSLQTRQQQQQQNATPSTSSQQALSSSKFSKDSSLKPSDPSTEQFFSSNDPLSQGRTSLPSFIETPNSNNAAKEFHLPPLRPPYDIQKQECYETALELCRIGKLEEDSRRYENALVAYKASMDYFKKSLQDEKNPELKQKISETLKQFLNRAEQLIQIIEKQRQESSGNPMISNGGLWCYYCNKPIEKSVSYKISGEKTYHISCMELTIGLVREVSKTFLMSNDVLRMRVILSKKTFLPKEEIVLEIFIDNGTSKRVNFVAAYLVRVETVMQVVVGGPMGVERKVLLSKIEFLSGIP